VPVSEVIQTILRDFPLALAGSVLAGVVCAILGVHIVARRVVFLGAVLTQVSVVGLTLTFLFSLPHTLGSVASVFFTILVISRLLTGRKVPRDAVLGVVFVTSIALRILVLQKTPRVEASEIESLLRGDILFVTPELFYLMVAGSVAVLILHAVFRKEFALVSCDPETAATQGYMVPFWDLLFYLSAGIVISFGTHMVGDTFVFGFLVVPAITALLLARSVRVIYAIVVLIGIIAPAAGLVLAFVLDFPASPMIVSVASFLLGLAWLVSLVRRRG
jgi:ABC-type Mn2+/Zn2+ transport system permease subunit